VVATGSASRVVLGTLTLDAAGDPEEAWPDVRDLGRSGGLAPLPAARLAVAVTTLVGRRDPTVVEIARVEDADGRCVTATIHGGNASSASAPPGLVDTSRRSISADGTVSWELTSKVTDDAMTGAPAWAALNVAAAHSQDSQELLIAVLAAVARQASRAEDLDSEMQALRRELNESNQGLLALHAELSYQHDEVERARVAADILDLSKIESGSVGLEALPFDLFACVEDAIDMLAARAAEKNLILAALFAADIPASIVGDALRLRQILVNLLANAVRFTTEGHVVVEVTQRSAAGSSRELAFGVRDTGSGIPADRVEKLFTASAPADASTAHSRGGTGLGLTICRQLAGQMGGEIVVDSTVGVGSVFTCTIRARAAGPAAAAGDGDPFLCGVQVLVVNEQALYAEAIGRHLTGWGAEVVTAASVDAAVSRSGDWTRAALAIIDASRPGRVASDVARLTAASAGMALPVLCVTPMTSGAAPAGQQEPVPSVRVPIRRDHLRQAVRTVLGQGATPPDAAHAGDVSPAVQHLNRRVLYVDDNPVMTAFAEHMFAADPTVTLQAAPDGRTALELALHQQPDLVVLDLYLTGMSGEALLRKLRADPRTRSIPVVIASAETAPATIGRLTDLGVAGHLSKPFTAEQLKELVSRIAGPGR
jgi:signal transduction histidine kinase/DNA-binding response OmpR family regulator